MLPDGSFRSKRCPTGVTNEQRAAQRLVARVVEYVSPGLPDAAVRYRLMTTLLDPNEAPAQELAAVYHERWQDEAVFDELKTHLSEAFGWLTW